MAILSLTATAVSLKHENLLSKIYTIQYMYNYVRL